MMKFLDYTKLIEEATTFLAESFDNPHTKTELHRNINHEYLKLNNGVTDYHEYELGNDATKHGVLISYKRNSAYEIHHERLGVSGKMTRNVDNQSNPRFVATMLQHAKELLDKGHSVRIVGHAENGMFSHYHRIAKALARKHGYFVSTPVNHTNSSNSPVASEYNELTVHPKLQECLIFPSNRSSPLSEIWKIKTFS